MPRCAPRRWWRRPSRRSPCSAMLRLAGTSDWRALAGAIALATTPVFHVLSYSFMSDVPTVTLIALSLYAFVRWLRFGERRLVLDQPRDCAARLSQPGHVGDACRRAARRSRAGAPVGGDARTSRGARRWRRAVSERGRATPRGHRSDYRVCIYWRSERSVETVQTLTTAAGVVQIAWAFTRAWLHLGLMLLPLVLVCGIRLAPPASRLSPVWASCWRALTNACPLIGNLFYEAGSGR